MIHGCEMQGVYFWHWPLCINFLGQRTRLGWQWDCHVHQTGRKDAAQSKITIALIICNSDIVDYELNDT